MMHYCDLKMEARVGIEPTNKGFADLCLTTWLPRPTFRARLTRFGGAGCHFRLLGKAA